LLDTLERTGTGPDGWAKACDELAWLLRSRGVVLAPYSTAEQTLDVPMSNNMRDVMQGFHSGGWMPRDPRQRAFPMLMAGATVTDFDLFARDEIERQEFYADWLRPNDLKWFAATGFAVEDSFWAVSVHRRPKDEPFSPDDLVILREAVEPFRNAARRARALGHARTDSLETLLSSARRGVALLGWSGRIARMSGQAEALLARLDLLKQGRLRSADPRIQRQIDLLVARGLAHGRDHAQPLPAPLTMRVGGDAGIVLDMVPMPRDFASLLAGAAALLTVHEVTLPARPAAADLKQRYGLTVREAQLCMRLGAGLSLSSISDEMGITVDTARQYLKSVFAKTGTNRQAELVAMLSAQQSDG